MTLGSVPSEDRLPDSHHPRPWAVERTFNRQLQERSDIGLSPPPVSVTSGFRVHTLQGRVMDARAEVVSDRRLASVVPLEGAALAAHFYVLAERRMLC